MNNQEIFEKIITDIASKVIKNQKIEIYKEKNNKVINYTSNIKIDVIYYNLKNNVENIFNSIIKNIKITDVESLRNILYYQFNSSTFRKILENKLNYPIQSNYRVNDEIIIEKYVDILEEAIKYDYLFEKVFAISKNDCLMAWILNRKKIILCGYMMVIIFLALTYFVFISK